MSLLAKPEEETKASFLRPWWWVLVLLLLLLLTGLLTERLLDGPGWSARAETRHAVKGNVQLERYESSDRDRIPDTTSSQKISADRPDATSAPESMGANLTSLESAGRALGPDPLRLAVVNLTRVFDGYYRTKEEQVKLKAHQTDATNKLKAELHDADAANTTDLWSAHKAAATKDLQTELFNRHKEIVQELQSVIVAYSQKHGFDLVIDDSSSSAASGVSFLVYVKPTVTDITDEILAEVNAGHEDGKPSSTTER